MCCMNYDSSWACSSSVCAAQSALRCHVLSLHACTQLIGPGKDGVLMSGHVVGTAGKGLWNPSQLPSQHDPPHDITHDD
jgi:hypothetical protein